MANCLECNYQAEIDRLRNICLKCSIGGESCGVSHGGQCFVSNDSGDAPGAAIDREAVRRWEEDQRDSDERIKLRACKLRSGEYNDFLRLVDKFAAIGKSWDDSGLVCGMLAGRTLGEMADERGITIQSMHGRWEKIIARDPVWKSIANGSIGKNHGAKPKPKAAVQLELF